MQYISHQIDTEEEEIAKNIQTIDKRMRATQKMVDKVDKKDKVILLLNVAAQSAKNI